MIAPLELDRFLPAPVDRVWRLVSEAAMVERWLGPGRTRSHAVVWQLDPGGPWQMDLCTPDGATLTVGGRFLSIDPPRRLELSWAWASRPDRESRVIFELTAEGAGTRLRLHHADLPDSAYAESHLAGWSAALPNLERLAAASRTLDGSDEQAWGEAPWFEVA